MATLARLAIPLAVSAVLLPGAAGGRQPRPPTSEPSRASRPADDAAILLENKAEPAARCASARRLLLASDNESRAVIADVLRPGAPNLDSAGIVLNELAALPTAPAWLLEPLGSLLDGPATELRPRVVAALGSIRSREAVRRLLNEATSAPSGPAAEAAFAALARLTGRSDLGTDAARWTEWFARVEFLVESDWQRVLAEGLAQSADRANRERDSAVSRLMDANLLRYQESQNDTRWVLLAGWLRDDLPRVRRQGIALAKTELANARTPGPAVAAAAVGLLQDPLPEFRRGGAELIESLAPADGEKALADALLRELDPGAATAMLRAARRYPTGSIKPVVLQWLTGGSEGPGSAISAPRRAAIDAAAVLFDRGLLSSDDERQAVLAVLRSAEPASLSGPGMRLLAQLGSDADREKIGVLLTSANPELRSTAAEAIVASPGSVQRLVAAAENDDSLFLPAARAVGMHQQTLDGFLRVLSLPAAGLDARREALLAIGRTLEPRDLLPAARATEDRVLRERLLARLETIPLKRPAVDGADPPPDPAIVAGLLLLAQTRLDLRLPAAALAGLETLEPIVNESDRATRAWLMTIALLWLDRVDDAAGLGAPCAAWLDGFEQAVRLPHAPELLRTIRARFGDTMSPDDAQRLERLEAQLPPELGHSDARVKGPRTRTAKLIED